MHQDIHIILSNRPYACTCSSAAIKKVLTEEQSNNNED